MTQEKKITLELSLQEINAILNALGSRPYLEVYSLIQKVQSQASGQIEELPPISTTEDKGENSKS